MPPLISVIITTYNAKLFICDAIQSVAHQTYPNWELIVVDDGSTDNTQAVVKALSTPLTFITQSNQGISAARNAGLNRAHGRFIAFLDADDVWMPQKLELQMKYLDDHPEVGIVFSLAQNTRDPHSATANDEFPVFEAHVPINCLVRQEVFDKVGNFNLQVRIGEFAEWYGKVLTAQIKIGSVKELLVRRRIHGNNVGIKQKHRQIEYVRMLKQKLDRERKLAVD